MSEKNKCPASRCCLLLIPVIITIITVWILKYKDSTFAIDPLSVWFSVILSFFTGVWISVGLKRVMCHKDHSHDHD